MTTTDVNTQIQNEYMEWNKSQYSGNPALPKDILETFKRAVFKLSPSEHKTPTDVIKKIMAKKVKDLTNTDVPIILNTISAVRFCELYKDLNEALEKNGEIEILKMSFNLTVKQINEQTEIKRNNLLSLSGGGTGKIKTLAQA